MTIVVRWTLGQTISSWMVAVILREPNGQIQPPSEGLRRIAQRRREGARALLHGLLLLS